MGGVETAALACACALSVACGFNLWRAYEGWVRARRHKASIVDAACATRSVRSASVVDRIIARMERLSQKLALGHGRRMTPRAARAGKGFASAVRLAGLEGMVSPEAFAEMRVRMAACCAGAGFVCGLLFSVQFALVLAFAGVAIGLKAPGYALRARATERAREVERHLPEMLDVVALGMRSGLPFDSSLRIYASHFDTLLSRELENARVQWSCGLARRDEALRSLAATYDSVVLSRVVETVIKSIRYGSSMVSSLESDAADARGAYQAGREERIAKAPVKMMVPTGVLILPAMLVMVLGPVLLELVQGGF